MPLGGPINTQNIADAALSADALGRGIMEDGYIVTAKMSDEALLGSHIGIYDVTLYDACVYK